MLTRRHILAAAPLLAAARLALAEDPPAGGPQVWEGQAASSAGDDTLQTVLTRAEGLAPLKAVIVSRERALLAERGYHGYSPGGSTNIKSASKSIISAMVGIAIERGLLEGGDQPIAPLLRRDLPERPDPRLSRVTIGHLLSMQSGLGPSYGRLTASRNWVRFTLSEPFVEDPGGPMVYATASTHLLSAILMRVGGRSTEKLAEDWFEPVEGFRIGAWSRDPQRIPIGGNQMAMTTRSLHAFGELYRRGGRTADGVQVVPETWVRTSWEPRTTSRYSGDGYGYGWFLKDIGGEPVRFAWGYGGQMLYIVPSLALTVTMTSESDSPSAANGYRDQLHALLADIIAAVRRG
ncbi:serine hydrolase [Rhizobium sp. CSW-27]|uniref:serine hydrolase domain-containing protein n=1 Tax=Rhizobium sp. CSW-27 TaxID=2839985 RepID=UPI001C015B58|nr:serine hydrolase [Rhizobium sp. CSW-27]MBT9369235.1 beta-lactamase family protein [Rhizobium sp. CSW-27]